MREVVLNLTSENKLSEEINFLTEEEYILIHLNRYLNAETIYLNLSSANGHIKRLPKRCESLIELNVTEFAVFQIESILVGDNVINGKIFVGSWSEIMLQHLLLTLPHHYQVYESPARVGFQIGFRDSSHLLVQQNTDGNFQLIRNLVTSPTQVYQANDIAIVGSKSAELIEGIYRLIRINCAQQEFLKKQESQLEKLRATAYSFFKHY
jgi:hypothetical protein